MDSRRTAAAMLTAIVALATVPAPAFAESRTGTSRASVSLQVRIVIPPVLRLKTLRQPVQLVVTARDVAAGFVEIERGMEMELLSNLRSGHAVQFSLASPVVQAAEVSGLERPVHIAGSFAEVRFPRAAQGVTRTTLNLGFRLLLAANAQPGVYDWPVSMTLIPA